MASPKEIAYLGPEGTYAHEMALKRYRGKRVMFTPCLSVEAVFEHVARSPQRRGVVPIVNSSGGTIYETIDGLMNEDLGLRIEEELSLDVRLALLGRKRQPIETIYSHFVPFEHCDQWLRRRYPGVNRVPMNSTAISAREASHSDCAAAISNRRAAAIYGLDVLVFPIPGISKTNVTHFIIVGRKPDRLPRTSKTSLAVYLHNQPGALLDFLTPMAEAGLNLSTLISRPIKGKPRQYAFFVDVDGDVNQPRMKKALKKACRKVDQVLVLGSYPSFRAYTS
jgi:chorismate mutase/prephenate dehydratase